MPKRYPIQAKENRMRMRSFSFLLVCCLACFASMTHDCALQLAANSANFCACFRSNLSWCRLRRVLSQSFLRNVQPPKCRRSLCIPAPCHSVPVVLRGKRLLIIQSQLSPSISLGGRGSGGNKKVPSVNNDLWT